MTNNSTSADELIELLIGRKIVAASEDTLTLDDGTKVTFETDASSCCSWIELKKLATCENIITHAYFADDEDQTGGEGEYKAWLTVVTEAGELNVAEADGNASNGYYIHGFALGVTVSR